MKIILSVLMLLISGLYILYLNKKKLIFSSSAYWILIFNIIYSVVPLLSYRLTLFNGIDNVYMEEACKLAIIGLVSYLVGNFLGFKTYFIKTDSTKIHISSYSKSYKVILFYTIITFMLYMIYMILNFDISLFFNSGAVNSLVSYNSGIPDILLGCTMFFLIKLLDESNTFKRKFNAIMIFGIMMLVFSITVYTRRFLIYPIVCLFYLYIIKRKNKLNFKYVFMIFLTILVLVLIMIVLGFIRTYGLSNISLEFILKNIASQNVLDVIINNTDFAGSYYFFSKQLMFDIETIGVLPYFKVLFMFIPRFIWVNKPEYSSVQIIRVIESEAAANGFSAGTGVIGEAFACLGIIGIIIIPFLWGIVCSKIDKNYFNKKISEHKRSFFYDFYPYFIFLMITESHRGDFAASSIHLLIDVILPVMLIEIFNLFLCTIKKTKRKL